MNQHFIIVPCAFFPLSSANSIRFHSNTGEKKPINFCYLISNFSITVQAKKRLSTVFFVASHFISHSHSHMQARARVCVCINMPVVYASSDMFMCCIRASRFLNCILPSITWEIVCWMPTQSSPIVAHLLCHQIYNHGLLALFAAVRKWHTSGKLFPIFVIISYLMV